MNAERLDHLLAQVKNVRILVIGDLMLDEFIWGKVSRISPEAPVPVVEVERSTNYPGGAANVVRNLCAFTPHAAMAGVVGKDATGAELIELLNEGGACAEGVHQSPDRPTTRKTRIIARHQQVVRVDRELKSPLTPKERETLLAFLIQEIPKVDALIIEDYGKGMLDQALVQRILQEAQRHGKIVTVDPNPHNVLDWSGATAIKPNRSEALAAAGLSHREDKEAVSDAAKILLQRWKTNYLLITLGDEGMLLYHGTDKPFHTPTRAQEVFDVTGAGDTAIALFTLALAAGSTGIEAAELANHASGVVVGKLGTATLTPDELRQSFQEIQKSASTGIR